MWRTIQPTVLLIFAFTLLGCRKDPVIPSLAQNTDPIDTLIPPNAQDTCTQFILPELIQHDTISVHYEQYGDYASLYWQTPGDLSLRLVSSSSFVYAWGSEWLTISISVRGNPADSIGVFLPPWLVEFTPRSFEVGDTLDPFAVLRPSVDLFFSDALAGVGSRNPPPVWYVGIVKIIDGQKHVGYVRIGTSTPPGQHHYWLEHAQLSLCPETPLVITE